jgi:selT/selW/selH-like putative selenoprotein
LAAAIRSEFGIEAELIEGDAGIFDVVADGKLLFSKHQSDRFPEPEEVLAQLR